MTNTKTLNKILNNIEELRAAYPEQDRFIDKIYDCVTYEIYDKEDAISYICENENIMHKLFEIIDNENFDNRDITDEEFGKIITNIKSIAENLDIAIYDYVEYISEKYNLND